MMETRILPFFGILFLICTVSLQAQLPAECNTPQNSHFRVTTIVSEAMLGSNDSLRQPMEIDIAYDGKVFFVERMAGNIRLYDPALDAVQIIAQFDQFWGGTTNLAGQTSYSANQESGLLSVAAHLDFENNGWVYVLHSPLRDKDGNEINSFIGAYDKLMILERFKMVDSSSGGDPQWRLDMSTRKKVFEIPFQQQTHIAGSMRFTPDDSLLLISIGDNTGCCGADQYSVANWQQTDPRDDASRSTANTNDLRGKIIRVKLIDFPDTQEPNVGIGTTYSIPSGNIADEYADLWDAADLQKVRPEIYTMGHRNPFRINYDPQSKWILFGENGPAATAASNRGPKGYDEWNVATRATFFGWPFFNGPNNPYRPWDFPAAAPMTNAVYDALPNAKPRNGYNMDAFYNPTAPVNYSPNNTGTITLPPAKGAIFGIGRNDHFPNGIGINQGGCTPMAGPVYRYSNGYRDPSDRSQPSDVKFPPWFDGKWFIYNADGGQQPFLLAEMDSSGNSLAKNLVNAPFNNPGGIRLVDMEVGPEGAIYVMGFGSGNEWSGNTNVSIRKIEYIGPPGLGSDACYTPIAKKMNMQELLQGKLMVNIVKGQTITLTGSQTGIEIFNVQGVKIWSYSRNKLGQDTEVTIPGKLTSGLLFLKITQ